MVSPELMIYSDNVHTVLVHATDDCESFLGNGLKTNLATYLLLFNLFVHNSLGLSYLWTFSSGRSGSTRVTQPRQDQAGLSREHYNKAIRSAQSIEGITTIRLNQRILG